MAGYLTLPHALLLLLSALSMYFGQLKSSLLWLNECKVERWEGEVRLDQSRGDNRPIQGWGERRGDTWLGEWWGLRGENGEGPNMYSVQLCTAVCADHSCCLWLWQGEISCCSLLKILQVFYSILETFSLYSRNIILTLFLKNVFLLYSQNVNFILCVLLKFIEFWSTIHAKTMIIQPPAITVVFPVH